MRYRLHTYLLRKWKEKLVIQFEQYANRSQAENQFRFLIQFYVLIFLLLLLLCYYHA